MRYVAKKKKRKAEFLSSMEVMTETDRRLHGYMRLPKAKPQAHFGTEKGENEFQQLDFTVYVEKTQNASSFRT